MDIFCESTDLLVFSHLRWNFVFQRPQHLMSRFAKHRRVFYFEEPLFGMIDFPRLEMEETKDKVKIITPHLPAHIQNIEIEKTLKELVNELIYTEKLSDFSLWYYTPMALPYTRHLEPAAVLFDCMDELSLFKGAPQSLFNLESELLGRAHVVFTGGESLYQAKKHRHHNIHSLPSSIDYDHFRTARDKQQDPTDQAHIPHPRIGFYGVIDERMDIHLLEQIATLRPDYHFVVIGPIIKIDPSSLAKRANIHYLGKKDYQELPQYLAGWDCAMMPFAINDSTKYISPTKTPEFLAAGKPVVSTAINDVVHPYQDEGLAHIAKTPEEFVEALDAAMADKINDKNWQLKVDIFLRRNSWDKTFKKIAALEKLIFDGIEKSERTEKSPAKNYIVLNEAR